MNAEELRRRLSLALPADVEREFLERFSRDSIGQMRVALALAAFLYAIFGVLDAIAAPAVKTQLWIIRYAVECPAILAMFALSFTDWFRRYAQPLLASLSVFMGLGIIRMTMIAPPPANYLYHAGLLLVLMFAFGFARLRFMPASIASAAIIVVYLAATIVDRKTPPWIILDNGFFLVSAFILGGFACFSLERYARGNFVQTRELVQSRQLLIDSSVRAQLIFSALADALPGTDLDNKYRVEEKIGSGAFGTVYRARHLLLDAPVAVKVFRPASGTNIENSFERLRLEGISAKRLSHPNAVAILDFGIANSAVAFLVMELLEGHTLEDELRQHGRLPARRCAEIVVPVCSVLAEAHDLGIIHRDIKPGNIFLQQTSAGETVKVVDFGIAKLMEPSTDEHLSELTATGAIIGTPAYMAPERLLGESYGASSDIYSVGVMMYRMLTGHVPHASGDATYWRAVIAQMTEPVARLDSEIDVPPDLSDVVFRAMSPEPGRRPTALEMTRAIADLYSIPVPRPRATAEPRTLRYVPGVATEDETEIMEATEVKSPVQRDSAG